MGVKAYISRMRDLRGAFRRVFLGADGKPTNDGDIVLAELRRFCYGMKPTLKSSLAGVIDPYASVAAAARQEVFFRITAMLNLDDRDIARMEELASASNQGED